MPVALRDEDCPRLDELTWRFFLLSRSIIAKPSGEPTQDYKFEHGRRYHAYQDGKYALPNDDEEITRLGW